MKKAKSTTRKAEDYRSHLDNKEKKSPTLEAGEKGRETASEDTSEDKAFFCCAYKVTSQLSF